MPKPKVQPEWALKEHTVVMPHPETGIYEEGELRIEDPRPLWKNPRFKARGVILMRGEYRGFFVPVILTYSAGAIHLEAGRSYNEAMSVICGLGLHPTGWRYETRMYHDVFGVVPEHIHLGKTLIGHKAEPLSSIREDA